jgi:hypothetical protein
MAVADFNHDGKFDIAVVSPYVSNSRVQVLMGNGDGNAIEGFSDSGPGSPQYVLLRGTGQ